MYLLLLLASGVFSSGLDANPNPPSSYLFSKPSFNNQYLFVQSLQAETKPSRIHLHSCKWLVLDAKTLKPVWSFDNSFTKNSEIPIKSNSIIFDDGEHLAFFRTKPPHSRELEKQGRSKILPDSELIRFYKRGVKIVSYSAKDLKLDFAKIEGNGFPFVNVIRPVEDYTERWSWLGKNEFWRKVESESKDPLRFSSFDGKILRILFCDGTRVDFAPDGKIVKREKVEIKRFLDDVDSGE